jgi:hypothetical protein
MLRSILGGIAVVLFATSAFGQNADAPAKNRIPIVPGYAMEVPSGWYACDPAINAQLGNGAVPDTFAKMCADPPKNLAVPLIVPSVGGFKVVLVGIDMDNPAPRDLTAADAELKAVSAKVCSSQYFAGSKLSQCNLQIGTVAGKPGVTGTMLTPGDTGLAMKMRVAVIVEAGKPTVMIFIAHAALGTTPDKFGDDPDIEAMLASIASQ